METTIKNIIKFYQKTLRPIEITVIGNSMYPNIKEGDTVTIEKSSRYKQGDIVVYQYKNEGLLIHRLLFYEDIYFCKGDNSYRIEGIRGNDILGKVTKLIRNNREQALVPQGFKSRILCRLSLEVSKIASKSNWDINKIHKNIVYIIYKFLFLRG